MPTASALQVFYGTVPVIAAILLANWNSNKRLDDINKRIDDISHSLNKRIDDLSAVMQSGLRDVKASIDKLESRVTELEKGSHVVRG